MSDAERRGWSWPARILPGMFLAVVLVFLPLVLAILEDAVFGTSYVGRIIDKLPGPVKDFLGRVYGPIIEWLFLRNGV